MSKSGSKFEHISLQDRAAIAEQLSALAEGFSKGSLTFTNKDSDMQLTPGGLIRFRVKASNKQERVRLSIRMSWAPNEMETKQDTEPLEISIERE